jgi:hypothetical protein
VDFGTLLISFVVAYTLPEDEDFPSANSVPPPPPRVPFLPSATDHSRHTLNNREASPSVSTSATLPPRARAKFTSPMDDAPSFSFSGHDDVPWDAPAQKSPEQSKSGNQFEFGSSIAQLRKRQVSAPNWGDDDDGFQSQSQGAMKRKDSFSSRTSDTDFGSRRFDPRKASQSAGMKHKAGSI